MKYDFDKIYDRRNTNCLKYDCAASRGVPVDVLPLWVADMDFRVPEEIIDAIRKRAEHGIFGYSAPDAGYFQAVKKWFLKRHGWDVDEDKFVLTAGVVSAISSLIRSITKEGESVIICQPVYYPFEAAVRTNGRKLVVSRLVEKDGYYTVDFEDFERKIVENDVKLFILCNPHNPVGRVWSVGELERMGDICLKHGVFVISDEIHFDFAFGNNKHTVFATVKKEFEDICAVCTAPTKTFNLAGLHISNIYIKNDGVRQAVKDELERQGHGQANIMGIVACQAAYTYGEEWLDELLAYLEGNIRFAKEYIDENLPEIKLHTPEGTYLIWLDMRSLGLDDRALSSFMLHDAKLWLDDGFIFGEGGSGYERVNVACPRATLKLALDRLKDAVSALRTKNT